MASAVRAAALTIGSAALVLAGVGISWATGGTAKGSDAGTSAHRPAVAAPVQEETVFVPITPCRIVDTRAKGGPVSAARSFYVAGSTHFADQGGTSGGCAVPASATAVSANVVATGAKKSGYVKGYPAGSAAPTASVLNFATASIANDLSLAVRPGTAQGLTLAANTPVQLVVDLTGYYAPQIEAFVDSDGTLDTGTGRVLGVSHVAGTGTYTVSTDSNIFNCSTTATSTQVGAYAAAVPASSLSSVVVHTWTVTDAGATVSTDENFNLTVTC